MSSKVQLRLISSAKMSDETEHDVIRFPKRARENFGFSNSKVVIGKGYYEISLKVKQAYKEDVRKLARMIRSGKLTEEEAGHVGFVSRNVRERVTRKKGTSDIWITEGINCITVGADPEFGLIDRDSGLLVRGSNVVQHAGKFGADGPGVEVRPAPSTNHLDVIKSMSSILGNPPAAAEKYKWVSGATFKDSSRTYWFGGHVHLGRPIQIDPDEAFPVYERIATVLDGMLALPMVRIDTPEPHLRRNGCPYNYGKAGDIRADYPEQDRFEYRVLSGLWVAHPTLSTIAIGAAKCIAETAYGRIAENDFDPVWASNSISKKGMLKSFNLKGIQEIKAIINRAQPGDITADHLQSWERGVRNLDRFDDYRAELTALIALSKETPGAVAHEMNLDMKENWHDRSTLLPKASKRLRTALDAVEEKIQ